MISLPFAVLDLIPPLPSLWLLIALALTGGFWYFDKKTLATVPAVIAAVLGFFWLTSVIGWVVGSLLSVFLLAAAIAVAYMGVKHVTKDRKGKRAQKKAAKRAKKGSVDGQASEEAPSLAAGSGIDIEALLAETEQHTREEVFVERHSK